MIADSLERLAVEIAQCHRCPLAAHRTWPVLGRGPVPAPLMLIGEAPGADEDQQAAPFVGPAGQLLDQLLTAAGLDPSRVYIANVVKCRPPRNRTPTSDEREACLPFLARQIALVDPPLLVAMGVTALQALAGTAATLRTWRGRWHAWGTRALFVTVHPAALLHRPTPDGRAAAVADWAAVAAAVRSLPASPVTAIRAG